MGVKGRQIVNSSVKDVIDALRQAYIAEWTAHYTFQLAANLSAGLDSRTVAEYLRKSAADELVHANRLAERLRQLGSEPPRTVGDMERESKMPSVALPEDPRDVQGILRTALAIERHAIDLYQNLYDITVHGDPVTNELVTEILVEEVAEEDEIESLLGE